MSAQKGLVEMISPDDMLIFIERCGVNEPCTFSLLYNRKKFFAVLLPPTFELESDKPDSDDPDYYDFIHGFNPGPKYPPVPGPLPGYDPSNSIESTYLRQLNENVSLTGVPNEAGNRILKEIQNLIRTVGGSMIQELAGSRNEWTSRETLDNALNPETIWLQMVTIDGEAKLIRRDDFAPPTFNFEPQDVSGVSSDLPVFHPSQIEILEGITPWRAYKVMVKGEMRFCKVVDRAFGLPSISRDCKMLQQINDADLDPTEIRVPHLEGLVSLEGDGKVIGFLTNYIENHSRLVDLFDPSYGIHTAAKSRRERWDNQIEQGIRLLHNSGVVWGDVNPFNVLVDENDDLWMVDFGGGYCPGFVSAERMNTKEGDLEGLEMIRKYLNV